MTKRYDEIQPIVLAKFFAVDDFRMIRQADLEFPGGLSEIPIKVDLKKAFAKQLDFDAPWDGEMYAFIKCKQELFKKTGYDNTVQITMSDWEENITIIFEDAQGNEKPVYSTSKEELRYLLENCRKPEAFV